MRNTKHKLFHDKSLKRLCDEMNICGVVRNHFLALSMRYYRRYGKPLSYAKMSKHLTKLKKLEKYKHWHIPYSWCVQNVLKRLARSFREMSILKRGHPRFKSCKKHKGMTFSGEQVKIEKVLDAHKNTKEIIRPTTLDSTETGIALRSIVRYKVLSNRFKLQETHSEICISHSLKITRKSFTNPRLVKRKGSTLESKTS